MKTEKPTKTIDDLIKDVIKKSKQTKEYSKLYIEIFNLCFKQDIAFKHAHNSLNIKSPEIEAFFEKLLTIKAAIKLIETTGSLLEYKDLIIESFIKELFDSKSKSTHRELIKRMTEGFYSGK